MSSQAVGCMTVENIVFENGTCRYDVKDLYGEDCSYEVKGKNEAEM